MIRFESDYLEGAHEEILNALVRTNLEQTPGYGVDVYCESARAKIREACGLTEEAGVHFLSGGTQTNLTAIAAFLRPMQGALCADTAHIAVHESGAVEATGHKVITLPGKFGKITAKQIDEFCTAHFADATHDHMVQPGLVYISQSTELGTLYTLKELKALRRVTRKCKLLLYIDGARLGYALASSANDVTLPELAKLSDAFYIGGTKVGALFGEALVITNKTIDSDFRYVLKQRGGMLAKGRMLGLQFDTLFTDDLYMRISRHAMELADRIREHLTNKGIKFLAPSPTNQLFPILEDRVLESLKGEFSFSDFGKYDADHSAVRICTSWATKEADVDKLLNAIDAAL